MKGGTGVAGMMASRLKRQKDLETMIVTLHAPPEGRKSCPHKRQKEILIFIRVLFIIVLLTGSVSADAEDTMTSAFTSSQGFAYVLNQQGKIHRSPDFKKIHQKIIALYKKYAKIPKSERSAGIKIALTALVGGVSHHSKSTLLGKFTSQCLVIPTSLFNAKDAKRMGIYKLAYDFIKTKDSRQYRLFLLCEPGVHDSNWQKLLSFPSSGFNFIQRKHRDVAYWYFINKTGEMAFYF